MSLPLVSPPSITFLPSNVALTRLINSSQVNNGPASRSGWATYPPICLPACLLHTTVHLKTILNTTIVRNGYNGPLSRGQELPHTKLSYIFVYLPRGSLKRTWSYSLFTAYTNYTSQHIPECAFLHLTLLCKLLSSLCLHFTLTFLLTFSCQHRNS